MTLCIVSKSLHRIRGRLFLLLMSCFAQNAFADPVYQPSGPALTYGNVANGRHVSSVMGNPAAPFAEIGDATQGRVRSGTLASLNAGLEYGNVDDLFELFDRVALFFESSDDGSGGEPPPPGQEPDDKPPGIDIGDTPSAVTA